MNRIRHPFLLVLAVAALLTAAACGSSDTKPSSGAAGTDGGGTTITISNFAFSPVTIQAKVGDTITVDNKDSAEHTVTATDNSFDTGRFAGSRKTFTLTKAGKFEYACNVHPYMTHGFIQVAA